MELKTVVLLSLIALGGFVVPMADAQTFSVIHTFTGGGDGKYPYAGVTLRGGILYGSASAGGDPRGSYGTVYQTSRVGAQWVTLPIFYFDQPNTNGYSPLSRVMFSPDGHSYGTTSLGIGQFNYGTVYQLTPLLSFCKTVSCFWTQQVLHTFSPADDGHSPDTADITFDPQGNIYGTTRYAGSPLNQGGTVYQLQRSGSGWTESILYNFPGFQGDGYLPAGGVIRDKDGNLFGTTAHGGVYSDGTVFELKYTEGQGWKEIILHDFQYRTDGSQPWSGLVMDQSGNLYGSTLSDSVGGGGTIFELSLSGDTWSLKTLHSFPLNRGDVESALSIDGAGNVYGTAIEAGSFGSGSVFRLTHTGDTWTYTSLHDFTGGPDGAFPHSTVAIDSDGTLYGTALEGGSNQAPCPSTGCGVVWMITP